MAKISTAQINGNFKGKDIISIDQFFPADIDLLFSHVPAMRKIVRNQTPSQQLGGTLTSLIFFEPSTRTFSSFSAAVKRLGGATIEHQNPLNSSSVTKGETLEDTMRVLAAYSDAIVIRHPEAGSAQRAADAVSIPVLNAGDGPNQHPTQTLLDLYTIRELLGRLDNLKIAFVGDMLHYRTFHGQFSALSQYSKNQFYGISPIGLEMPKEYRNNDYHDVAIDMKELDSTLATLKPDIVSVGRIPKEYIAGDAKKYGFVITPKTLKRLSSKAIVMHPLPRIDEIATEVDSDPRAVYFTHQIRNGLYVRMALLGLILGKIQ